MATASVDLNDASIAIMVDGRLVLQECGYAAAGADGATFGAAARASARLLPHAASNRHWRNLGDAPLARAVGPWRTPADIVQAHLEHLRDRLPAGCSGLVASVPSYWTPAQLGLLLGIARDAGLPIVGLADSAIAPARSPWPGCELWVLELTLHDAALTRIAQDGAACRGETQRFDWLSVETLERACAQYFGRAFLQTSRFDPFHDSRSEQALYDELPAWLGALRRHDSFEARATFRSNEFVAALRAADLRLAVGQAMERLVQKLRAAFPSDASAILLVPDTLADYPGALDALAAVAHCEIVTLEPGACAAGVARLRPAADAGALQLATCLPWDRPAATVRERPPGTRPARGSPTHIVYRGNAWRLGREPFHLGAELGAAEFGLAIAAPVQALSRRHCSVRLDNGRALLHDHSRFGTRLNGELIEGSAVLHAGDVIQVGQPPVELLLVAEVEDHAPAA